MLVMVACRMWGGSNDAANITDNTTFTGSRGATFTTALEVGATYTIKNTGLDWNNGAGGQTVTLLKNGVAVESVTYNGNMNGGTADTTMVSVGNREYNVNAVSLWKAANDADDTNISTVANYVGQFTDIAEANLVFSAEESVARNVTVTGAVTVKSIELYDNYTFSAGDEGTASLSVTNGLALAGGKTLTLNEGLSLTLNGAVELDGSSLTTQYSNGYTYSVITSSLAGNGAYVAGDNLTINGSSVSAITKTDSGVSFDITGTVYHVVTGTVKLGENDAPVVTGDTHTGYEVHENATLDINGKIALRQSVWLNAGAALTNTGNDIGNTSGDNKGVNKQQISHVYLKGDASVTNTGQMGIINSNWAATTLDLAGHTLTKTESGMFSVANAAISAGTIDIQEGEFLLSHWSHNSASLRVDDAVKVNVAEGAKLSITGTHSSRLDADFLLNSTGAGTISIHRNVSMGSSSQRSTFAGTISVVSGELRLGNAADSGTNAMQEIDLSDASLDMDGGTFRYFGGTSTIGTLNVNSTPSSFSIYATDTDGRTGKLTFNKVDVAAQQRLLMTPYWSVNVDIGELTGAGSIQFATGTQAGASKCIYTIGSVASGFGSISNAGTLKLGAEGKTVHLGRTVENTGSITLNGTLVIENLDFDHYEVAGGTYYNSTSDNATESISGYGALTYQIIKGGTVTIGGSFSYAGSYSMTNGLVVTDSNVDTSRFFVNENIKWNAVGDGVDFTTTQYSDASATTFIVAEGKKLDVNGDYFAGKHFWLGTGATLQNTGSLLHGGSQQFQSISLTGDAYLNSGSNMGLIGSGDYSATELNLNGNKLTKQGDGAFLLLNTTVNGGGTIQVDAGLLQIGVELNSGVNADVTAQDTHFVLNGGELSVQNSGNQLTAASVSGTGDVTGAGSLVLNGTGDYTLDGQLSVHSLTNSTNLTVTGAASSRNVTNTGKLLFEGVYNVGNNTLALESGTAANAEAIKFASDVTASDITIGASNTSGSNSQGTVSFLDDVNVSGKFYARRADFVFGDGKTAGVATLGRIELGDSDTSNYTHTGTISNNYTVVVTGTNNTADYKSASLILGEWNTKTTLNVNGNLLAKNAKMQFGDSGGTLNIKNGGTVAVMGISRAKTGNNPAFTLTMSEGGKLVLGSAGLDVGGNGAQSYTLNGGTLGISAESVTVNEDLTVSGNVTFDTTLYEFNDAGTTLTQGTSSGTLTVNKINVSANNIKVNFNGAGNHVIANIDPGSYTGITYNVKNGATLKVSGSMWMKDSSICLEDGASFNKSDNILVTGTGHDSTIARDDAGSTGSLTTDNDAYTISNAEVEMTRSSSSEWTLGMKLTESSLTNSGSSLLKVTNAGNTITSLAANGGNVMLLENMTVKSISAKDGMVVTVADEKTIKMDGGVDISTNGAAATMTATSGSALARLQEDASFTIEDMTLVNTTITAATTTEVKLNNVTATNTMLAGGKNYTLSGLNAATVGTGGSNRSITYSTGLGVASGATLTLNLDVLGAVEQHGSGVYDITITLDGFGADYAFTQEDLAGLVKFDADSWLGKVIGNVTPEVSIVDEQQVAALSDNVGAAATPSVSYTATPSVGTLVITITGLNVPEPASATLGLAALMMLCARRRRND